MKVDLYLYHSIVILFDCIDQFILVCIVIFLFVCFLFGLNCAENIAQLDSMHTLLDTSLIDSLFLNNSL